MPICKNCKSRIDKFNKDICPICGVEHPFEGVTSDTIEITTALDVSSGDYKPRKRPLLLVLFIFLGFTGAPFFYMFKNNKGLTSIFTSLGVLIVSMLGFGLGLPEIGFINGLLIGLGVLYFIYIILGLVYFLKPNQKDGRGDFII